MSYLNRNENNSDSESENDELDETNPYRGREAFIFLVDAFLYEKQDRFQECLELIRNAFFSGLLTRDKDLIGIVFNNTKESPDPDDVGGIANIQVAENTAIYLPLRELTTDIVQYYMNIMIPETFAFENKYGMEQANFSSTLRLCSNMFQQSGHKLSAMTISYFTDRNTPHEATSSEFQKALLKSKDLEQMDIDFNVIPMNNNFDYSEFYKEFICMIRCIDLDTFVSPNPQQDRKLITNRQLRQNFLQRCLVNLNWDLGDNTKMSVGFYNYYKKNVYPKTALLLREDNSVITAKRVNKIGVVDPETNMTVSERYLKPGDERKIITIGGQRVDFSSEEVARQRSPAVPGLRLLGFVNNSRIIIHDFIKSACFLYPNDSMFSGSARLFRALWERCLEREKAVICLLITKRKSNPHFVALVPTEHRADEKIGVIQNDGFRIVFLPFSENYRRLKLSEWAQSPISDDGIDKFGEIIKKLKIKFSPSTINDPSFDTIQSNIIGLTFDVVTEGSGESCMPDVNLQDSRIESQTNLFFDLFGQDSETKKKRKADNPAGTSKTKAIKISDDQINRITIETMISHGTLKSLSVKQLRNCLQENNVPGISSASKAVLIEKVLELDNQS